MIVKHVSTKSGRKRDFAALVAYIVDAQQKQERVGAVFVSNCCAEQPSVAVTEILNTQMQNVRATSDKTYHMIVSFRPGEQPDDATLRQIEARLCDALGYGAHQRISAVHRDTDNLHMHVAINKIHPTRYTMHEPFNDFWRLARTCEQLERELGLEPDNHQPRKSASENRAADMEQHAGVESLIGWIQRECMEEMRQAASWPELHDVLRMHGLRLHERGNGLAISAENGTTVKASSIGREFSKARLESRLGAFVPVPDTNSATRPTRTYEAMPLRSRVDTSDLYAAYQQQQQRAHAARLDESKQASARKQRQVEAAKRNAKLKRALVKASGMSRPAKKLVYAAISRALLRKLDAIVTTYREDRGQIGERHRRRTWADWLQSEAAQGNLAALSALRARPGKPAPHRDTVSGVGVRKSPTGLSGQDGVTKQGTVLYRFGATTVRDDGTALQVTGHTDAAGLQAALRLAQAVCGDRIQVTGSAEFKEAVVQAAVAGAMTIAFSDAALEQQRRRLRTRSNKENQHAHATHRPEPPAADRPVLDAAAAAAVSAKAQQKATQAEQRPGRADKSHAGAIGRQPPPERQHRLRTLSELGMVRVTRGSELLLSDHVPAHLAQSRAATTDPLRWHVPGPGNVTASGAPPQQPHAHAQRRHAGLPVPQHGTSDGAARALGLGTSPTRLSEELVPLRDGDDAPAAPTDAPTLPRLQRDAADRRVAGNTKGTAKPRGHRR